MKLAVILGSTREGRYTERLARWIVAQAGVPQVEVELIDLRDYPMPIYNADDHERNGFDEHAARLQRLLSEHQGLLICSPEYNGSLSGALKNALDWASRKSDEFKMGEVFGGKVGAIMTESPGSFGGLRCLGHLRSILSILGVNVLPSEIAVSKVGEMFDGDDSTMTNETMKNLLENLGASLVDTMRKLHGEIEDITNTQS